MLEEIKDAAAPPPAVAPRIEPQGEGAADADDDDDAALGESIEALWVEHRKQSLHVRRTRGQLRQMRAELGARLHEMKARLVRTGRASGWAAFLRAHGLPRATADRHVLRHEASLAPRGGNRPAEAFVEPTRDGIRKLVVGMLPRLNRLLPSPESAYYFVEAILLELPSAEGRITELGVEIWKAAPKAA